MKKKNSREMQTRIKKLRRAVSNVYFAHERGMAEVNNRLKAFEDLI
jgi:hypothetical protein